MRRLPEAEAYEASHLWDLLDELRSFTIDFEAAVRILDFCLASERETIGEDQADEHWLWVHGRMIPARDAAMTIYQFGRTLTNSIPNTLRRCPTITALTDQEALKAVRRDYQERFGNYTLLRHAVSHRAELRETTEKKQSNAAIDRSSGHPEIIWGNFDFGAFVFTIKGQRLSLPISMETHSALVSFMLRTFAAFPEAERASA